MATTMKKVLGALAGAALLGGCATGYYDDGYYGDRYAYGGYGPTYYYDYPYHVAPSVGFGVTHFDREIHHRHRHRDHDHRGPDRVHHDHRGPLGDGNAGIDFTDIRQNSPG